jgi:ribosomal protein L11 methyltransferase
MPWQQLTMPLGDLNAEALEAALLDAGAVSVTYTDAADQPILEPGPGEAPLWTEAIVTALFDEAASIEAIGLRLVSGLALDRLPAFEVELLADRDWEREWLRDFQPMRFGKRLWVCPADAAPPADDAVVLRLDPGLAFGTGTHATTALCLERLDALALSGRRVLDFGCGSGILAIAALRLGAAEAVGIDIDPQALTATMRNAVRNGVDERLRVAGNEAMTPHLARPFDIVIANILAKPLIELAPALTDALAPGGRLLLSGILAEQAGAVAGAYRAGCEMAPPTERDGWVLLEGRRRQPG